MRLLVLGGTRFLSRAVAEGARDRGHRVVAACRGVSGPVPEGVTHLAWDRSDGAPAEVRDGDWDAVVDVARLPSHVRRAVAATPDAHWVFVSTISVYPDNHLAGTPETLRVHEPMAEDADPAASPEAYGRMKVACEQAVREGARSSLVVRPGLIAGPGDPTGRFSHWPWRLAEAARPEALAPGDPADPVQVIDVRDLAEWIVTAAEEGTTGTFDAVGDVLPIAELLGRCAAGVGTAPSFTWVPSDFLESQAVEPWAGERSLPLWLPRPEYDGMLAHDPAPAVAAGLRLRPVEDTARDTLAWLRATPHAARTGLSLDEEATVLEAWHARGGIPSDG